MSIRARNIAHMLTFAQAQAAATQAFPGRDAAPGGLEDDTHYLVFTELNLPTGIPAPMENELIVLVDKFTGEAADAGDRLYFKDRIPKMRQV